MLGAVVRHGWCASKVKPQRGLTLLEFLVVFAIMAVLLSLAAPNFSRYIISSKSNGAADLINQDLNFARYYALRNTSGALYLTVQNNSLCLSTLASPSAPGACDVRSDPLPSPTALQMMDASNNALAVAQLSFDGVYGAPSQSVTFIATTSDGTNTRVKKVTINLIGLISTAAS